MTFTDPLVGTSVEHYEILARIGGGGMGVVYAARDTRLGRQVALKFLPPQWSHDEGARERFIREAQAASAIDHPNICTVHDIGTSADGRLFLVMAYYEGQTLKQMLEAGPLEVGTAVEIAAQLAEGLAKAHARGIVHRDIKPGNLMVCDETVKILDFGLAKFANALQLTTEGSTVGTAAYMSPEQVRGEEADARSDVWAAGVVLYEMLAGRVPFAGAYAEAVSYAIRNEPPPSLREIRPEVPEALEQIVFRALHKEPAVRFQSARDLARALRTLQGRTIAPDLLTEPVPGVAHPLPPAAGSARPRWWRRAAVGAAAVVVLAAGAYPLLTRPVERTPVAVVPVANRTGYGELDPYRLALTQQLTALLADSPTVRVLPYARLRQIVTPFAEPGGDVSSREAVQALTKEAGARVLVVPTLLYENGAWRARVEFRDVQTSTSDAQADTAPVVSSLAKDTAHTLVASLVPEVEAHFAAQAPLWQRTAAAVRAWFAEDEATPRPRMATLDAAEAFERATTAYERLEYADARTALIEASRQDSRNPVIAAWLARVSQLLRHDADAADAADRALALAAGAASEVDALFVAAAANEARRNIPAAEEAYRALAARYPDEPRWAMELAGFLERQGRTSEAIEANHAALARDAGLVRPHLDLCRLYTPSELASAKTHGQTAFAAYRRLRDRNGEAQALFCLIDVLRLGTPAERAEANAHAAAALAIVEEQGSPYTLARGHNYAALAAAAQGRLADAAARWEQALDAARTSGNRVLEPLVLMNLGVANRALGHRTRAVDYYRESAGLFAELGQEQRAAELQANAGAILIEYGNDPERGLRDVQNALVVSRKLGNTNFEVFAAQVTGAYYRYAGRFEEAQRELNRALAVARERDLRDRLVPISADLAQTYFDRNDYIAARDLLQELVPQASPADRIEVDIRLARVLARLGQVDEARALIETSAAEIEKRGNTALVPLLEEAAGEVAYEAGDRAAARRAFQAASALWTSDLPHVGSVEARAYLGLLDGLEGRTANAVRLLTAAADQARRMGRLNVEARSRLFLARVYQRQGGAADALNALRAILPDDGSRSIGPELRAQVLFASGDRAGARAAIDALRRTLPPPLQATFSRRPDIRPIVE